MPIRTQIAVQLVFSFASFAAITYLLDIAGIIYSDFFSQSLIVIILHIFYLDGHSLFE